MQNKALIAEPNQRLAQRIGKELEAIGLAVDYVRDGASALKQLSAGGYRLLLTNLILPQLSGAELVRRLRAGAATADLPICLMSPPVKDPAMVDKLCADQNLGPYFKMPFNFTFFRQAAQGYLGGNGTRVSAVDQHKMAAQAAAQPAAPAQPAPAAPAPQPAAPAKPAAPAAPPKPKAIELQWGPDQNIRSFDQLLLRVRDKGFTGAGRIQGAGALKMVLFSRGYPIEATPLHPPRPFQDHVRDARALKPPEMEALTQRVKEPGDEILLVQMGALQLGEFLIERRDYAAAELAQCFAWSKGQVHLEPTAADGAAAALGKLLGLPTLIATFAEGSKQFAKTDEEAQALAAKMAPHHFVRTDAFYNYAHLIPYDEKTQPVLEKVGGEKPLGALLETISDPAERAAAVRLLRMLMVLGMVRLSSTPAPDAEPPFPFRPFWKPAAPSLPGQAGAPGAPAEKGESLEVMDLGLDLEEDLGDFVENLREEEPVAQPAQQEMGSETRKLEDELIDELERVKKSDYYKIFDSQKNRFKFQDVKKKYFELQGRFSPDKFVMSSGEMMSKCEEYLEIIGKAFETLSDVPKKSAYDQQLAKQRIITEDRKTGGGMQASIAFEGGRALIAEGDFAAAETEIRKAMALAPGHLEHEAYLAWATYKNPTNKADMSTQVRARQMLDRALVKNPRLGIAYAFRASIFMDQGKLDLASNDLTKALKFDPQCLHAKQEQRRLEGLQQKR